MAEQRYEVGGLEGLADRSHRPRSCPHQIPPEVKVAHVELRLAHPSWGPRRPRSRSSGSRWGTTTSAATPEGDLLDFFSGNFDTENAGPKRESKSYLAITDAIGLPAHSLLFLSDSGAELDAARAAGWQTIGLRRPGEPNTALGTPGHPEVTSFGAIMINGQH